MAAYATVEDVFRQGLLRGSVGQKARFVASVNTTSDRLEIGNHGLALNTPIQFQVKGDAVLPSPLAVGTVYYAKPVADSDSLFEVAAAPNGSAIDLTTAGSGAFAVFTSVNLILEPLLETYSRWFDGKLIGHQVPLTAPYPAVATHVVAVRTAAHAARMLGLGADAERLYEAETLLLQDIAALARGVPLRDERATPPANAAVFAVYGSAAPTRRRTLP